MRYEIPTALTPEQYEVEKMEALLRGPISLRLAEVQKKYGATWGALTATNLSEAVRAAFEDWYVREPNHYTYIVHTYTDYFEQWAEKNKIYRNRAERLLAEKSKEKRKAG